MNAAERLKSVESFCLLCKKLYHRHLNVRADQMSKFLKYTSSFIIERQ